MCSLSILEVSKRLEDSIKSVKLEEVLYLRIVLVK